MKRKIGIFSILFVVLLSSTCILVIFFTLFSTTQNSPNENFVPSHTPIIDNRKKEHKQHNIPQIQAQKQHVQKFRYPKFNTTLNPEEIQEIFDSQISFKNCHICEIPKYTLTFDLTVQWPAVTYIDAVLTTYVQNDGKLVHAIVFMFNIAYSQRFGKKFGKRRIFEFVNVKLYFKDGSVDTLTKCVLSSNYKPDYVKTLKCFFNMSESGGEIDKIDKKYLTECYYARLFAPVYYDEYNVKEFTQKPILVRHCDVYSQNKIKNDISICSMVYQKDIMFLIEWLEWNYMIGVEHIYLYVHLGKSDVKYNTTIFYMIDSYILEGKLTTFLWNIHDPQCFGHCDENDWTPDQHLAFTDCLHRFRTRSKWLLFIDGDEFIVPSRGNSISNVNLLSIFNKYSEIDSLIVNSFFYYLRNNTKSNLLTENYPIFDEINPNLRKSIVNPNKCDIMTCHECIVHAKRNKHSSKFGGKCKKRDFDRNFCRNVNENELFIAHYFYKKYHFYNRKINLPPFLHYLPLKSYDHSVFFEIDPLKKFLPELNKKVLSRMEKIPLVKVEALNIHEKHDYIDTPSVMYENDTVIIEKKCKMRFAAGSKRIREKEKFFEFEGYPYLDVERLLNPYIAEKKEDVLIENQNVNRECDINWIIVDDGMLEKYFKFSTKEVFKKEVLAMRFECSLESSVINYPISKKCVHYFGYNDDENGDENFFSEIKIEFQKKFDIKFIKIDNLKKIFQGTIVNDLFEIAGNNNESILKSDILSLFRVAIMEKNNGGLYLDSDVFFINNRHFNFSNYMIVDKDVFFLDLVNAIEPISKIPETKKNFEGFQFLSPSHGVFFIRTPIVKSTFFKYLNRRYREIFENYKQINGSYWDDHNYRRFGMDVWRDFFFEYYNPVKNLYFNEILMNFKRVEFLLPPRGLMYNYFQVKQNLGRKTKGKDDAIKMSNKHSTVFKAWRYPAKRLIRKRKHKNLRNNLLEALFKKNCPFTWNKYWNGKKSDWFYE